MNHDLFKSILDELEGAAEAPEQEKELIFSLSNDNPLWREMMTVPLLSPEEEQTLFAQLEENPEADFVREKIILANLRLVHYLTGRFYNPSLRLGFWDLFQEGFFGLCQAVNHFEHRKGYKFSTFAVWAIKGKINRAIDDKNYPVRIPIFRQKEMRKLFSVVIELSHKLGREPSIDETAEAMKINPEMARTIQETAVLKNAFSLDDPLNNAGSYTFADILPDQTNAGPEEKVADDQLRKDVDAALTKLLTPREIKVIEMRFGLNGGSECTLEKIGKKLGLTKERVRQIEAKTLKKLRGSRVIRELRKTL